MNYVNFVYCIFLLCEKDFKEIEKLYYRGNNWIYIVIYVYLNWYWFLFLNSKFCEYCCCYLLK